MLTRSKTPTGSQSSLRAAPLGLLLCTCLALSCLALSACGASSHKQKASARTSATITTPASVSAKEIAPPTDELRPIKGLAPETVLASVRGQKITLAEVRHRMATMDATKNEVPEAPEFTACVAHRAASAPDQNRAALKRVCQGRYEELLRTALNSLIRARWVSMQAQEDGLRVDEAALDREIARGLKVTARLGQTPASTGRSLAESKFWARIDAFTNEIYEEIKRRAPRATPQRIAAYYEAHKASYALAEQRDLHLIRTDSEASAKRAVSEIRSGRSFASVVREVSTHQPIHTQDGLILGLTYKSYAEPVLADAIFRAKPHVLSGPVRLYAKNSPKIAFGYYVFEVLRIHPAHQQSLAQVKAGIAHELPEALRLKALKSYVAAFKRRWRSRSSCRRGFVVENCRQYSRPQPGGDEFTL